MCGLCQTSVLHRVTGTLKSLKYSASENVTRHPIKIIIMTKTQHKIKTYNMRTEKIV